MIHRYLQITIICLISCAISACTALSNILPTQTPFPTYTPYPTQTPYPTFTPIPSPTSTPEKNEVNLENLRTAFDEEGNILTNVYSPSDVFYAVGDLDNAPAGTVVEAQWVAVQIEGYESGELIYEQAINDFTDESFSGTIYFQLSNDNGWPNGEYKIDVYLNGSFVGSVPFSVR